MIFIFLWDECSICSDSAIPLRNWQIHKTLTWDVDWGNTVHKKASSISFPRLSFTGRRVVNLFQPLTLCQELQLSCFPLKLFILKESALLITANDTDVQRPRALFNNESIFLSPGMCVTNCKVLHTGTNYYVITACFLVGQTLVQRCHPHAQPRKELTWVFINALLLPLTYYNFKLKTNGKTGRDFFVWSFVSELLILIIRLLTICYKDDFSR